MLNPNGASIQTDGDFARDLRQIIEVSKPTRLIETGTCAGKGSTRVIASALQGTEQFYSIECNPELHRMAAGNVPPWVHLVLGLSVPKNLLPSAAEIERNCATARQFGVDVDPDRGQEAQFYGGEVAFDVPDDRLRYCFEAMNYDVDFVMLDSSGGMGKIEFDYLMTLVRKPFTLALDDVNHVKHYQSFREIKRNRRFRIIANNAERHGYVIARYNPNW